MKSNAHPCSSLILREKHDPSTSLPIDSGVMAQWREGNPNFAPFEVGQRVLRKVIKSGRRLEHKLTPRFEGPYTIKVANDNKVSYVIERLSDGLEKRVHYDQIKSFKETPEYLRGIVTKNGTQASASSEDESSDSMVAVGGAASTSSESESSQCSENVILRPSPPRKTTSKSLNASTIDGNSKSFHDKLLCLNRHLEDLQRHRLARASQSMDLIQPIAEKDKKQGPAPEAEL